MKKLLALVVLASTMVATLATAAPADAAINCATPRILNQGYRAVARCLNQRADNQLSMIVGLQSRVHSLESSNTVAGLSARIDSLEARMNTAESRIDSQASINSAQANKISCISSGGPVYRWYKQLYTGSGWQYESWFDLNASYSGDNANFLSGPYYFLRDACGGSTF